MKKTSVHHSRFPMIVTLVALLFFYAPLLVVSVSSFNVSKYGGRWIGFSLKWYEKLFTDGRIWEALINTLIIALIATFISTILGTLAALGLHRCRKGKIRALQYSLVYSPLVVPDILLGISMLLLFVYSFSWLNPWLEMQFGFRLELGFTTIIIAHVTFCISYVAMVVLGRLQDFDDSIIEAAQDLGANRYQIFFKIVLPVILPGVIAGALFAFTLSIDDFVITFFVKGAGDTTLPIYIQSAMRRGTPAVINALSVVFLVLTFLLVFISQKLLEKKK